MRVKMKVLFPGVLAATAVSTAAVVGIFRLGLGPGGFDIVVGGLACVVGAAAVGYAIAASVSRPMELSLIHI